MLRIRSAGTFALAIFFGLTHVVAVPQVQASEANNRWGGWAELGGFLGSTHEDRAEAVVFLPVLQSDKGLFFTDVRGKLFEEQVSEVNAAFGYRHMHSSGWNFGGWLGTDRRETSQDNVFWAAAGGLEAISEDFDVRLNGYVAVSDPEISPGLATAGIEGGQVFLIGGQEVPLSGFDGEVGARVPLEEIGITSPRHGLRVYAGGFHFDDKDALDNVTGPKARLEWRIDDVLAGIPGSRLALETEWRSDEVRGGHIEAGVRFRLPFSIFSNSGSRSSEQPVQWRRMMDGLERDTDIVTGRSDRENVADVLTGVTFDRAVDVTAATGVTDPAADAGGNTLLVADGSGGAIDGPQALQANQTLLGGGGSIQVRGVESGVVATLTAPGQKPTFTNSEDVASLTLADRTHLAFATVTGKTANVNNTGVLMGSDQFAVLQDVNITSVGREGVEGLNRNTVRLIDVNVADTPNGFSVGFTDDNMVTVDRGVFDSGLVGVRFNDGNTFTIADTTISAMGNQGIQANNTNVVTLTGVRISDTGSDGVEFNEGNTVTVSDTSVSNAASRGFDFRNNNVVSIRGTDIIDTGSTGVFFGDGNTFTIADTTVSRAGLNGISANSNNVASISGADILDTDRTALVFGIQNTATITDTTVRDAGITGMFLSSANNVTVTGMTMSDVTGDGFELTDDNVLTLSGTTLQNIGSNGVRARNNNTVTVTDTSVSNAAGRGFLFTDGNTVTATGASVSNVGSNGFDFNDNNVVSVGGADIFDTRFNGFSFGDGNDANIADVTIRSVDFDGLSLRDLNTVTVTGMTVSDAGADGIDARHDNVLTVSGSTITDASGDGIDVFERNTVTISDTSITDIAGDVLFGGDSTSYTVNNSELSQRTGNPFSNVIDMRNNATLVISGSTLTGSNDSLIDVRDNGNVTINQSTFNGSPRETIALGAGNTLSGSGNVDNTVPTVAFCGALGPQTGQISFTNGASCP